VTGTIREVTVDGPFSTAGAGMNGMNNGG